MKRMTDNLLPHLYHLHHRNAREDLKFWVDLARSRPGPVLELGCGTGRVLFYLKRKGIPVYGIDIDRRMLAYLLSRSKSGLEGIPPVFQADMTAFHLDLRFSIVILPCNTFSTLDQIQRVATLERVKEHLARGGLFSASLPNPSLLAKMPETGEAEVEGFFSLPGTGADVQVSSAWERKDDRFRVSWYYDLLFPEGTVQRHSLEVDHVLVSPQTYLDELAAAGLMPQHLFGSFNKQVYSSESPYLIIVAG
jgi:SAM-dependent methyltransferase